MGCAGLDEPAQPVDVEDVNNKNTTTTSDAMW
jgi:hypothetical protein